MNTLYVSSQTRVMGTITVLPRHNTEQLQIKQETPRERRPPPAPRFFYDPKGVASGKRETVYPQPSFNQLLLV